MKRRLIFVVILMLSWTTSLLAMPVKHGVISKITFENENSQNPLISNPFNSIVKQNFVNTISTKIDHDEMIQVFGEAKKWQSLTGESKGTHVLRFSISANKFVEGKLEIRGADKSSLFLNQVSITGDNDFSLRLINQDYRALLIVSGVEQWQDFSIEWTPAIEDNQTANSAISFGNDSDKKRASMKQYYDAQTVGTLNISPDGELLIWSKQHFTDLTEDQAQTVVEIIELASQNVVYRWQAMNPGNIAWREDSSGLVFTHNNTLLELQRDSWRLRELASDLKGIRSVHWLSDSELLIGWHKSEDKPHKFTKRYRGLEDRWSYWRGDLQIQLFDTESGLFKQVTDDNLSSNINDLDRKKRKVLITRNPMDYAAPPHSLTQLFELELDTGEETLLGEYRELSSAMYHKSGIIISAGPDWKGGNGNNVSNGDAANTYDGQLYLIDKQGEISALSKDFKPAIGQITVLENGNLVLSTTDQDKQQLYQYDVKRDRFEKLTTKVEAVTGFTLSEQKRPYIVYKGSNATTPQSVFFAKLGASKHTSLFDSAKHSLPNVDFITLKDWDYTTQSGQAIDGRVYYPSDFDASQKYPAIIYYYGGTVPVGRSYTGRWPFSLWANQGYVVYVLQPSGAIGYGQDFSARHVNAWGINTADEIIESTKAFVDAHPFVDPERLGNMGASYGGFMTMYLSTKTDLFAASISHAGISNLTSYWGHGWWGYGYSGVATRGTFPWNNTDFYTQQSPVFAADKVQTPLLLIHGDADTNVPVGESHQMYTALKLLDKDVELIEFQGDDHHVNSRERRLRWWKTILAYFDMKLKDQPEWWEHLYPAPKT